MALKPAESQKSHASLRIRAAFMRMLASSSYFISSGFLYQKQRPLWAWNVYYSVSTDLPGFAWLRLYGDTPKPDSSNP